MSIDLNETNIWQVLFKAIRSNNSSVTSYDDSDIDDDYCCLINNLVIIKSSPDSDYDDSKIMNIDVKAI